MLQPGVEIANRTIAVAAYADLLWPCRALLRWHALAAVFCSSLTASLLQSCSAL